MRHFCWHKAKFSYDQVLSDDFLNSVNIIVNQECAALVCKHKEF